MKVGMHEKLKTALKKRLFLIPLRLELLHDVEKLVVYAWIVCKTDFDLVQIRQGIFNLKKGGERFNAAQSTTQSQLDQKII